MLARADDAVARRVDLLGSGPVELGRPIDWLTDFKTGIAWPAGYAPRLDYADLGRPSDVKVPWELSRVQWLLPAGQAFLLTGDETYAAAVRDVLDEWIAANPYAWTVNWSVAMESALRILSWSWLLGALGGSESWSDAGFRARFLRTLWLHGGLRRAPSRAQRRQRQPLHRRRGRARLRRAAVRARGLGRRGVEPARRGVAAAGASGRRRRRGVRRVPPPRVRALPASRAVPRAARAVRARAVSRAARRDGALHRRDPRSGRNARRSGATPTTRARCRSADRT